MRRILMLAHRWAGLALALLLLPVALTGSALVLALLPQAWRDGTLAAIIEAQYPLHTGKALGLTGRVLICASGIAIALMAITGLVTTTRKLLSAR